MFHVEHSAHEAESGIDGVPARVSRRRFLFLGAAAGFLVAVAPPIELAVPTVQVHIRQRFLIARVRLTGAEILASRSDRGAFVRAAEQEWAGMIQAVKAFEARAYGL